MENNLKEVMERLEKEISSLDGSISNKYWIIQGLHKAWEICHKVDDESNDKQEVIKLNNSYKLLKKFKLYYDKVENNIKYPDSHDDRVVSEFITEELINNGKNEKD